MNSVFLNCSSLISLDLSSFRTWNVKDTSSMFQNCISLAYLYITNFNLENIDKVDLMFDNLDNIEFINLKFYRDKRIGIGDILKFEEEFEFKIGLIVCRYEYNIPSDSFIYCCDYSFEGKLCLEKNNYITIYYNQFVEYQGNFWNEFRNGINFIYSEYDNTTVRVGDLKHVYEKSKVEIHLYEIFNICRFFPFLFIKSYMHWFII